MASIIDLNTRKAIRRLSPLATTLMDLVEACEELVRSGPRNRSVDKISEALDTFHKELNRDD
jgi:hypothetical protein